MATAVRAEQQRGMGMRKSHKGPNRNFVGIDEIRSKRALKHIYIALGLFLGCFG